VSTAFIFVGIITFPAALVAAIRGDIVATLLYGTVTAIGALCAIFPED